MVRRWWHWARAAGDCGGAGPPPYRDVRWVEDVTPDQQRMEVALERLLGPRDVVLHVGIGSSRIARYFADRVARIDGITVVARELEAAPNLPRYTPALQDKFRGLPEGPYDWILDNNPSSFSCCRTHFGRLLDQYVARLAPGGRFVTELRGLAYAESYAFGLSPRRFARLGRARGMQIEWLADTVLAWRRPLAAPGDR